MAEGSRGLGRRVGGAINYALGSVGHAGRLLREAFHMPGRSEAGRRSMLPGDAPGIEHSPDVHTPPPRGHVRFQCFDVSAERVEHRQLDSVDAVASHAQPDWASVRWLRVEGLHPYVIDQLRQRLGFHTLAAEDVLQVPQRPRVEAYEGHIFAVTQMMTLEGDALSAQQVAIFLLPGLLLTFQEHSSDAWRPIEARLDDTTSRLRTHDAGYLAYALLDTIIDHGFPLLERYADRLEELEDEILASTRSHLLHEIHSIRRELAVLRRVMIPTRELLGQLAHKPQPLIDEPVRAYLSDVHGHSAQLVDMVETFRDLASNLTDLYLSLSSNRTNETMRVLTVIATTFIPITFLAGVYGMNFRFIPELQWKYGYALFWALSGGTVIGLLWYFHRRGWFG